MMRVVAAILAVLVGIVLLSALRTAAFPVLSAALDRASLRRVTPRGDVHVFARPRGPALLVGAIYLAIGLACLSVGVASCRVGCSNGGDAAGVLVAVFAIPWSLSWIGGALGEIASTARRLELHAGSIVVRGRGPPVTYALDEIAEPRVSRERVHAPGSPGAPAGDVVLAFAHGGAPVRVSLRELGLLGHAAQIVEILAWQEAEGEPAGPVR